MVKQSVASATIDWRVRSNQNILNVSLKSAPKGIQIAEVRNSRKPSGFSKNASREIRHFIGFKMLLSRPLEALSEAKSVSEKDNYPSDRQK